VLGREEYGNVYGADQGNNRTQVFAPVNGVARIGAESKGKQSQRPPRRGKARRWR
jgi:hypothetical protein